MENHDNFIQKIHQKMEASNVLLAFTGEVNMRIINAMINSVRNKLDSEESTPRIQKKVYSIMVECLESLFYGYINTPVETDRFNKYSIFTIRRNQHGYHLISGNYLLLESMTAQKNLIEKINNLNLEGKKELFRQYVSTGNLSEYSLELSILDIALKSENTLHYEFKQVDEKTYFYIFRVNINTDRMQKGTLG